MTEEEPQECLDRLKAVREGHQNVLAKEVDSLLENRFLSNEAVAHLNVCVSSWKGK